jgi:hypothetical protein
MDRKLLQWWTRPDGSRRGSDQFELVYGQKLGEAWQQWIAFEHGYQSANLAAIRKVPTTPYGDVTKQGLGSVSRVEYDPETRTVYAGVRYPGGIAHRRIEPRGRQLRRLVDIRSRCFTRSRRSRSTRNRRRSSTRQTTRRIATWSRSIRARARHAG